MKITVNKKLTVGLLALAWVLVGCNSEVDKCTNAFMEAESALKKTTPHAPIPTRKEIAQEAEREANFRLSCLRASKGG